MPKLYKRSCDVCGNYYERKNARFTCSRKCMGKLPSIRENSGHFKKGWFGDKWSKDYEKCIQCQLNESPHARQGLCKKCYWKSSYYKESSKKYRKSAKGLRSALEYRSRIRQEVLAHYSNGEPKCQCCGEKEIKFLAFDHINGGGGEHRKKIKGYAVAQWLRKNNYPEGFQVLCHNCNMAKGFWKICPHQTKYEKS